MAKWSDFPDATSEAIRLREENAKLREINAEQAEKIRELNKDLKQAEAEVERWMDALREER